MSKYHPLDVRYKGPSTAYRGSAFDKRQAAAPDVPEPVDRPNPAQSPTPRPRTPIRIRPWRVLTRSFAVVRRIWRIGAYMQVALALLIYFLLMNQVPSIDLSSQIISIIGE